MSESERMMTYADVTRAVEACDWSALHDGVAALRTRIDALEAELAAARAEERERCAGVLDRKARGRREKAHRYRHLNTDRLGRFHPCPSSARQCDREADDLDALAAVIRASAKEER